MKLPFAAAMAVAALAFAAPQPRACAQAVARVPGSTSPDGRVALYYSSTPAPPPGKYEIYGFYFCAVKTGSPLSAQLVPDTRGGVLGNDTAADDAFDSKMLFDQIAGDDERRRATGKVSGADSSFVTWSPDSRWVAIEGGAHKFWHMMVYHLVAGSYGKVALPRWRAYSAYFRDRLPHPRIKDLGAASKVTAKDGFTAYACWLGNGILAADSYPWLLRDDDYTKMGDTDFYFILDCRAKNGAAITGLCR